MAILPPALIALAVQRFIVKGLTLGAVKGQRSSAGLTRALPDTDISPTFDSGGQSCTTGYGR
jgi:hypothetical protein